MPDAGRRYASAFAIEGKGFVCNGVGSFGYLKDLWEYDPATDEWEQKEDFPGAERYECVSFVIGKRGYVGCGAFAGTIFNDFYEYDWPSDSWTQLDAYPGAGGDAAMSFAIDTRGYVGTGSNQNGWFSDFWQWNLATEEWTQLNDFPGPPRAFGSGFAIGKKGYFSMGESMQYYKDYWEFDPDTTIATGGVSTWPGEMFIYPNPNHGSFVLRQATGDEPQRLAIADLYGRTICELTLSPFQSHITLTNVPEPGIYLCTLATRENEIRTWLIIAQP
jgi:N-acetylneuraminic acid mutarotase